jgi:hypothetical protein
VIVETAKKYLDFHEATVIASEAKQSMPLFNMEVDRESMTAKVELDRIKRLL